MGERRGVCRVLLGKRKGKRLFARPSLRREIIINWIFKIYDVRAWPN